jgi:UDP-N-acetylmuramate--alanine ligase
MLKIDLKKIRQIHFIGIGGIGVSAIARLALFEGRRVSGSDTADSAVIGELRKIGADIKIGQQFEDIPRAADLVIYSTAIRVADDGFYSRLKKLPIPSISYAEALGEISSDKFTIAVSGTHGKTTTTAMIAKILIDAGLDPTVIVGSLLKETGANFVAGKSNYLVVEVDEYQRKFLTVSPKILVVTNIDKDHLDYFKNLADIKSAFAELASKVPTDGAIITDFYGQNIGPLVKAARAPLFDYNSVDLSGLKLQFPGEHNLQNARAAIIAGGILGVSREKAIRSLNAFQGAWRRFEYKGKMKNGALLYDDYAHNPRKVRAALSGAREMFPGKKIIAVFQPHLFSRTKNLFSEFVTSFGNADELVLLPIFPAREPFDRTISSEMLLRAIQKKYPLKNLRHIETFEKTVKYLKATAAENDIVILIGAGNLYQISENLVERNAKSNSKPPVAPDS